MTLFVSLRGWDKILQIDISWPIIALSALDWWPLAQSASDSASAS